MPRLPAPVRVSAADPETVAVPPDTYAAFTVLAYETDVVVDAVTTAVALYPAGVTPATVTVEPIGNAAACAVKVTVATVAVALPPVTARTELNGTPIVALPVLAEQESDRRL